MINTVEDNPLPLSDVGAIGSEDSPKRGLSARRTERITQELPRFGILLVFVLTIGLFTGLEPKLFFTTGNALAIIDSDATIVILALAVSLTLRLGDLDLSFGATMGTSGILLAYAGLSWHLNIWLCVVLACLFGSAVGAVNAFLVVGLQLSSFVATLGTMTIVEGIGYGISNENIITQLNQGYVDFITKKIVSVPFGVWIGWVLALVFWLLYEKTRFGRLLLFVGGSREAARLLGLPTSRIRVISYIGSGIVYALAGIVLVGTVGAADPSVSSQYLLPPLAAAFLGTTVIQLGRFNVVGTIIGAYFLSTISTGLALLGASTWVGDVFNGGALVVAITIARFLRRGNLASSGSVF